MSDPADQLEHCGFNGGVFVAEFDCLGEPFVPIATIGITPEIRVVNLGDCRTPFCHTEKGISEQSWVKSDLWLWRYCNFSGKRDCPPVAYPALRTE